MQEGDGKGLGEFQSTKERVYVSDSMVMIPEGDFRQKVLMNH